MLAYSIAYILLLTALYLVFEFKKDLVFWLVFGGSIGLLLAYFANYKYGYAIAETTTPILNTCATFYVISKAVFLRKKYVNIIFIGMCCSIIGLGLWYLFYFGILPQPNTPFIGLICEFFGVISIPISISWFLGKAFAVVNQNLIGKLDEVKQLSTEKQQILATQNETLERQVEQRTAQLNKSLADLRATQTQLIQKEKMASLGELFPFG